MGQGQSQPEAVQPKTEAQAEGVSAASQEKEQPVDRPAATADTTQSEIAPSEPEHPHTGPVIGTTAAQGTKSQGEPAAAADLHAVHDNPVFETDPLAGETEPVANETDPIAEPPLPAEPASSKATTPSPVGGPSYTSLPADEFHDAPDEFAVDSHPIGDLQDSDSAVSGLAGGEGTAPEGPGIAAKEPHDAGGEIKADNPVEETNGIPPATAATPTSATKGLKSKAAEDGDDKVPGAGCFNCFSTGKAPSKKAPKKGQAGKAPASAAAVPAAAAATAGGIAVAGSTPGAGSEPEAAAAEGATPAAPEEPLSTEALPAAVAVQYTDEGPDKMLPTTSAHPEEGGAAAPVAEPPTESADKEMLTDSATDTPALDASTPEAPAAAESQEPPPSKIPKPQPMYTSYHLDEPDTTAATATEPTEAVAEGQGLAEPAAQERSLADPVAEKQGLAEPMTDERDLGVSEPAAAVDEALPVVDERSELQLEHLPAATGEVPPTPQKEVPLESMAASGEMTPLTKIQHAHHTMEEEEPAPEEPGYGGHNELLEPMSSYDYEDAAVAARDTHPVEYEGDLMARHDDVFEPQGESGGEPAEVTDVTEAQPNEVTDAPDGHAAEIAAGSALATGAAAGAVAATAATHDKDALVQTKQDAGEAAAAPVTAAQTKASDRQKTKEAKALEKRKAREEAEKQKLAKKAANKKKGGSGRGLFGCFTGSAAAGAAGTAGAAKDSASGAAGTGAAATPQPQAAPTEVAPVSSSPDAGAIAGATAAGLAVGGAVGAGAAAYSTPFASPKKGGDEVEPPVTPAPTEAAPPSEAVVAVADTPPTKPGKPPKRSKSGRVDYSAIHMAKSPSARLREGYNPSTGLYDTPPAARTPPGAYSPLRASQPKLQSTVELARQASLQRKASVDRTPMQDRAGGRAPSARRLSADGTPIARAPPGKGIDRAEVSNNYRPLSTVYS